MQPPNSVLSRQEPRFQSLSNEGKSSQANQHKLPSMNHLQLKTAPRLFCAGRVLSCLIKPDRVIFLFPSPLIQSVSFAAKFCLELPEISLSSPNIA
jgi:hypothetical protein